MEQVILSMHHRVLIGSELLDPLLEEGVGGFFSLLSRHRPAEPVETAEMIGELVFDEGDAFSRNLVGFEEGPVGRVHIVLGRTPVLLVVVPFPAGRLAVVLHQETGALAHLAIEMLHCQMVAIFGPTAKIGDRAKIAVVGQYLDVAIELVGPFGDRLIETPFAGLDDVNLARIVSLNSAGDLSGKAVGVVLVGQFDIIDVPAVLAQFVCEVAHGREDQDDLLLVMFDVGRLVPHLRHQDDGVVLRAPAQRSKRSGKLVAENGYENGLLVAVAGHVGLTIRAQHGAGGPL